MGTLTVKSPRALNFHATSPVKERKIEILPDGEIFLQIIYDDNTKLLLRTANGGVHVSSNELLHMDSTQDKTDLTIAKQTNQIKQAAQPKQDKETSKKGKEKRKQRGLV